MTDTHTHLYFQDFHHELPDIIEKCREAGVMHLVLPNVDESTIPLMKEMHADYPEITSMAIGLHPTEVKEDREKVMEKINEELMTGEYVAVGEIGIDLYWDQTFRNEQIEVFENQLRLADKFGLPVIIHCREALKEVLESIEKVHPSVPLIFHSFTGSKDDVKEIRKICDPYFGINGVVTYKNASSLREALPEIGIERIVLETDSPYLTPVPHRGKQNNSSYLVHIKDKVAETLNLDPRSVETQTDENARSIFGI